MVAHNFPGIHTCLGYHVYIPHKIYTLANPGLFLVAVFKSLASYVHDGKNVTIKTVQQSFSNINDTLI